MYICAEGIQFTYGSTNCLLDFETVTGF